MKENKSAWWQFWKSQNNNTESNVFDDYNLTPEQNQLVDDVLGVLSKDARAYEINPYDISNSDMLSSLDSNDPMYYVELDDGRLSSHTLKNLSRHPIVSSIVQTRVNQVAEFAQFTPDEDLGFKITLRDHEEEPSEADKRKIKELTSFVQNCGYETIDFELTFEQFIRQIIRDSLVYDQSCFEIVRNRKGDVTGFIPVDASTIKRAKVTKEEAEKGRRDPDRIAYVQVINGKVVSKYKQNELCFGIRRPRTDISVKRYGYPELEELIATMNNLQSAEIFNASNFNNGISANGIIAVKSKMDPKLFRAFRREFYQMLTGVNNAKRTPLIQLDPESGEEINSINLSTSNREMEYNAWVSYLIKTACSVYQMDPAEIGFVFGSEGQSSALIQADPATRVIMGKEKGLRPLVRSLQSWINKYIIWQIDPRFQIEFTGMDSMSQKDKINLEEHRMKYMTLNEIRALHDLEEVPDGDVIAAYYGELKKASMKEGVDAEMDIVNTPIVDKSYYIEDDYLEKSETYKAPKEVAEEAQEALDAKKKFKDKVNGGTQVGWTRARQLANQTPISEETIHRMKSFFDRHDGNQEVSEENKDFPWGDAGFTSWKIWGGDSGRKWAEEMVEMFNDRDEKRENK